MALYGKDDVPSNLEIISLVLLGSFLTVSLFLAASTFYYRRKVRAYTIEEGRGASKSLHQKFGYFLSMSQQAVSADIIPDSAHIRFSQKTEGTKT